MYYIIINGFNTGIIGNLYISNKQEKINKGYTYHLIGLDNSGIIDDLGADLNVNKNNLENKLEDEEEEEDDKFDKNNQEFKDKEN